MPARHRLDPYAGRRKLAAVLVVVVTTLLGAGYAGAGPAAPTGVLGVFDTR